MYNVRVENHTLSSQKYIGTYQESASKEEMESDFRGSWGGYWVKFENGEFEYIAYTGD